MAHMIKIVVAWILVFIRAPFAPFAGPSPSLTVGPTWSTGPRSLRALTYNSVRRPQAQPDYVALVNARDRRRVRASYGSRARLSLVSIGGGL